MSEVQIPIKKMEGVLEEISRCAAGVSQEKLEALVQALHEAGREGDCRIFCDGAGRSRLQVQGFAMRLAQMGFTVHVVGEATAPALHKGDLLFVCTGSGETKVLAEHASRAKKAGAELAVVTANENSTLGRLSDYCIHLPASVKSRSSEYSIQPMGSLFEQCSGILFDTVVLMLMERMGISGEDMFANHSNLE